MLPCVPAAVHHPWVPFAAQTRCRCSPPCPACPRPAPTPPPPQAGLLLLVHGEVTDPSVDFFDREKVFIETKLKPLLDKVRGLRGSLGGWVGGGSGGRGV